MLSLKPTRLPISWKSTIHLPISKFPPRNALSHDQERYLKQCTDEVYAWQKNARRSNPVFVLHDGPPYANGDLHIGHALNKILKDITNRFQLSQGKRVDYVPGWDCHGLPIELKALEARGKQALQESAPQKEGSLKTALATRIAARALAESTIEKQKENFKQWGIIGDWDRSWKTMEKGFEINQLQVFRDMVKKGFIYRQRKPVYWSPSSRTALAEAELEYRDDHVSQAAFVKYPIQVLSQSTLARFGITANLFAVIWTTTPWTLPANRAIGYNKNLTYAIVKNKHNERFLIEETRVAHVQSYATGEEQGDWTKVGSIQGGELDRVCYVEEAFDRTAGPRHLIHADYVSADSGTGLVHLAPGHGSDDYQTCLENGIPALSPVDDLGRFTAHAAPGDPSLLEGKDVLSDGNLAVLNHLSQRGCLFAQHHHSHKYPYDWRSKKPVILRATEQWFANVGETQREALSTLDLVNFIPSTGKARLQSFVGNRKEWCISRQRAWGVPIPALFHKSTGDAVLTLESVDHIIACISERGTDAWWTDDESDPFWTPPSMRDEGRPTSYRRGRDTMDVWFDSGTSWTQTSARSRPDSTERQFTPADVYMEGTDQHRGWFQSSLLTYVAFNHHKRPCQAPFRTLVTHGFTLDANGHKMSKSLGNVISPQEIIEGTLLPKQQKKIKGQITEISRAMGSDALRLWVASSDFTKDITISTKTLEIINKTLSKYRVTFKQLLGIVCDYDPSSIDSIGVFGPLHNIAVLQLEKTREFVCQCYRNFEYHRAVSAINRYINQDLSAFYFESMKDAAYCGIKEERLKVQATCAKILYHLQILLAPITPILVQESWEHVPPLLKQYHLQSPFQRTWLVHEYAKGSVQGSLVLQPYVSTEQKRQLGEEIPFLMDVLKTVQGAQEAARLDKRMGSSLQCHIALQAQSGEAAGFLERYKRDWENILVASKVDICIGALMPQVSEAEWSYTSRSALRGFDVSVHIYDPVATKCNRCYRYAAPGDATKDTGALCGRCESVVAELERSDLDLSLKQEAQCNT